VLWSFFTHSETGFGRKICFFAITLKLVVFGEGCCGVKCRSSEGLYGNIWQLFEKCHFWMLPSFFTHSDVGIGRKVCFLAIAQKLLIIGQGCCGMKYRSSEGLYGNKWQLFEKCHFWLLQSFSAILRSDLAGKSAFWR
jgi:hypothetical protein